MAFLLQQAASHRIYTRIARRSQQWNRVIESVDFYFLLHYTNLISSHCVELKKRWAREGGNWTQSEWNTAQLNYLHRCCMMQDSRSPLLDLDVHVRVCKMWWMTSYTTYSLSISVVVVFSSAQLSSQIWVKAAVYRRSCSATRNTFMHTNCTLKERRLVYMTAEKIHSTPKVS